MVKIEIAVIKMESMLGKNTIIILPSFAERYLSTPLFSEMSDEKN